MTCFMIDVADWSYKQITYNTLEIDVFLRDFQMLLCERVYVVT